MRRAQLFAVPMPSSLRYSVKARGRWKIDIRVAVVSIGGSRPFLHFVKGCSFVGSLIAAGKMQPLHQAVVIAGTWVLAILELFVI
jgi:hypothetical protein